MSDLQDQQKNAHQCVSFSNKNSKLETQVTDIPVAGVSDNDSISESIERSDLEGCCTIESSSFSLDTNQPRQMSLYRKYFICTLLTSCAFQVTCLSTIWSQAISSVSEDMSINRTIATLGVTLFIFGQGIGPLLFSPISEIYGRRPVYLLSLFLYCTFQLMTSFGQTLPIMLIGRFFSGFAGGTFITVISGTFSDMFEQKDMDIPTLMFSIGPFLGPGVGPFIGGCINNRFGYRWIFKFMLIWSAVLLLAVTIFVPETYKMALHEKAKKQKRGKNYKSSGENKKTFWAIFSTLILSTKRPLMMIASDFIIFMSSFASGILLAIIYLFFVAYPIIFEEIFNFQPKSTGMTFMGITAGMLCTIPTRGIWKLIYNRLKDSQNDGQGKPEYRLPQMLVGIVTVSIGLLFFAFTIRPSIHFMVPLVASGIFGFGCLLVFNSVFSYVFEAYPKYSASASSCNLFFRSIMAGIFPLFGERLFRAMHPTWACTMLAGVTLLMCLMPVIFYKYGPQLREASRFAS